MNPRHERFAMELFKGKRQAAAYRLAFPDSRNTPAKLIHEKASRLAHAAKVRARLAELQEAARTEAVADAQELAEYLTRIIRTPVGRVTRGSDLAQEAETITKDTYKTHRVKMPGKIEAVDRLCRLMGYYPPERKEHAVQLSKGEPLERMTDDQLRALIAEG